MSVLPPVQWADTCHRESCHARMLHARELAMHLGFSKPSGSHNCRGVASLHADEVADAIFIAPGITLHSANIPVNSW
eukprot:scaffold380500_cov34-Prasinocladus_malaysianus.AAC.2